LFSGETIDNGPFVVNITYYRCQEKIVLYTLRIGDDSAAQVAECGLKITESGSFGFFFPHSATITPQFPRPVRQTRKLPLHWHGTIFQTITLKLLPK
jgi:hypothetical protein